MKKRPSIKKSKISLQQKLDKNVDSRRKSLYKTFSWRILATCITGLIGYALTGSLTVAGSIMTLDFFIKMVVYYYHERLWDKYDR